MKTLSLIDGANVLMRAFTASERKGQAQGAELTGATMHLFISSLAKHVRAYTPERLVVCWDAGASVYRRGLYPAYKAARATAPDSPAKDDVFAQARQFLTLAHIQSVSRHGFEGDDVIAAYCQRYRTEPDWRVVILSGDKDFLQLVNHKCVQVKIPDDRIWDAQRVLTEMGCLPSQLPDVTGLTGDAQDGVPGVRGVGPVKARQMLTSADWDFQRAVRDLPDPEQHLARLSRALVDLLSPMEGLAGLDEPRDWDREIVYSDPRMRDWLMTLRLSRVLEQVQSWTLWKPSRPPALDDFDWDPLTV